MFIPSQKFICKKNNLVGTVIRTAQIEEFGGDFYFSEENYVVIFETNEQPIATYNFIVYSEKNIKYNYVMNVNDMIYI
jgi:hypothetical protein